MDPSGRAYEDFVPPHTMVREPATHILSVDLSTAGFKKEHIRVQLVHSHRRLIVRGERPVAGNRWSRFRLEFKLPDGCDAKGIHARFERGFVRVTMPGLAPEPVGVDAGGQRQLEASQLAKPTAASGVQERKDGVAQQDGDRSARGGGEEQEKADENVQKQEADRQRARLTKDDGRDDDASSEGGEVAAASPSRQGYAFLHRRKKTATTVLGVVLVLISLGIYVKYSLWP